MRVGSGFDAHRFGGPGPLKLGGVVVANRGLEGTSDADVLAHAIADALLGAAALGDLGSHFPSSEPEWQDADSMELLAIVVQAVRDAGLRPLNVDATVVAESIRVAPHRAAIRASVAGCLRLEVDAVSVKATSTDRMGFIGRDEGVAAMAVVLVE